MQKTWKMIESLAHGYSSEGTQQELPNEYQQIQHNRGLDGFQNFLHLYGFDERNISVGRVEYGMLFEKNRKFNSSGISVNENKYCNSSRNFV